MLDELQDLNGSEEDVQRTEISVSIQTRREEEDDIIRSSYLFTYAKEWDKWVLSEYKEERANYRPIAKRNWQVVTQRSWEDFNANRDVDVPPAVVDELAEATGNDHVLQVPVHALDESPEYKEVYP